MIIPGDLIEVKFCSIADKNDFCVNLTSDKEAKEKLISLLNAYCCNQDADLKREELTHDEIKLGLNVNSWHRVKLLINSRGFF